MFSHASSPAIANTVVLQCFLVIFSHVSFPRSLMRVSA
jgi:hypothetical protein